MRGCGVALLVKSNKWGVSHRARDRGRAERARGICGQPGAERLSGPSLETWAALLPLVSIHVLRLASPSIPRIRPAGACGHMHRFVFLFLTAGTVLRCGFR